MFSLWVKLFSKVEIERRIESFEECPGHKDKSFKISPRTVFSVFSSFVMLNSKIDDLFFPKPNNKPNSERGALSGISLYVRISNPKLELIFEISSWNYLDF